MAGRTAQNVDVLFQLIALVYFLICSADAICPDAITTPTDTGISTVIVTFEPPTTNYTCQPTSGSRFALGANTITCTSSDDILPCSFVVTVTDTEKPTITCPTSRSANTNSGSRTGTVSWNTPTTDNVLVTSTVCVPPESSPFEIGSRNVTCTATDAAGNKDTCSFVVIITDNEDPVISNCPDDITKVIRLVDSQLPPSITKVITWVLPAATDNSGLAGLELTSTHEPGTEFNIGVSSITYTAVDMSGNTDTCQFNVRVIVHPPSDRIFINGVSTTDMGVCLTVTWPESADDDVTEYSIYAYKKGEGRPDPSQRTVVPAGINTYIKKQVCKLHPGEYYTVEVDGISSSPIQQWTQPNRPGDISLAPGSLSASSFQFTWQRSSQNVEQYHWWTNNMEGAYVTDTTDSVMIESLRPGFSFYVYVAAVAGSGVQRTESNTIQKLFTTAPLRESELLAYNYTESTINVAWVANSATKSALEPYMLFIEPEDATENYLKVFNAGSTGYAEFKGLMPNTEYHIRLISNLGLSLETKQKTRPGRVANLRPAEVLHDSITLAWDAPAKGYVGSYEIWTSPADGSGPINNYGGTSRVFSQLNDKTEYYFEVVAVYDGVRSVPQKLLVITGVTESMDVPSANAEAIAVGCVLGLLVLALAIILFVTCLKYRTLLEDGVSSSTSPAVPATSRNDENQRRHKAHAKAAASNGDDYEDLSVGVKSYSTNPHVYQNAKVGGVPKKKQPVPMILMKREPRPADYAEPNIHG